MHFVKYGGIAAILIAMIVGIIVTVFVIINQNDDINEPAYCFVLDKDPVRRYGIKAVYDFDNSILIKPNLSSECEVKQIWTIIRHGARYPDAPQIPDYLTKLPILQEQIQENYKKDIKSKTNRLCNQDLESLKQWELHPNVSAETMYHLAEYGREQMFILANRFKQQYPNIFDIPYSEEDFQFLHTYTEPCIYQSFYAIFEALFGVPYNEADNVSEMIRADKRMEKYFGKFFDQSPEPIRFTEQPIVQEMLSNIGEKLGFETPLNWTTVKMFFDICRYEYSWNKEKISSWCAVFTESDQKLLEYQEDLSTYYEYGYGNQLSNEMGCNQIKSLIYNFMKVANGEKHPKAVVHTSHRAVFESLQVALNITKDPYILTADNYEMAQDRKWRTTFDCPFATQITVVFYGCGGEEKYVHFTMNEKNIDEINYPGCKNGLCPWNSVFNQLNPIARDCNADYV